MSNGMGHFNMYRDDKGEWRWQFKASNGKIMADSGEGYKTKRSCKAAIIDVH